MLGQLLEFAVHAEPAVATLEWFDALGLASVPVGDARGAPYAAFSDGTITIGLHAAPGEGPVPTFVRPGLAAHLRGLRRQGVRLDFTDLADDQFHRAGFRDPSGALVVLLEARTFSPATGGPARVCACGRFLEWSVATRSLAASAAFWSALGLREVDAGTAPHAWVRLAGHGLAVGLHATAAFPTGLSFRAPGLDARLEYLAAKGFRATRGAPIAPAGSSAATLIMPDATPLYLLDAGD